MVDSEPAPIHPSVCVDYLTHPPMSASVVAAIEEAASELTRNGPLAQTHDLAVKLRFQLAQLVDGVPECVWITQSTGHALSGLLGGLDWTPQSNVVFVGGEYSAGVAAVGALPSSVERRWLDGRASPTAVLSLVDERTRLVVCEACDSGSGVLVDIDAVAKHSKERGALVAVDASGVLGAYAFRAGDLDFVMGSAYGWLMGPPGIAFAYGSTQLIEVLKPLIVGTVSVSADDNFRPRLSWAAGAQRFEPAYNSALDMVGYSRAVHDYHRSDKASVEREVRRKLSWVCERVIDVGLRLVGQGDAESLTRQGAVIVQIQDGERAGAALRAAGIVAGVRAGSIVLAPQWFTADEEVERAIETLAPFR